MPEAEAQTCYRHPDRETRVSCSSCGRPICPECMTPTPVGMRCPECASQRTRVVRNPTGTPGPDAAPATYALIAINVVVFLVEIAQGAGGFFQLGLSRFIVDFALFGPSVAEGEWYRLVTSGFLHGGLFHLGLNMFLLLVLGRMLEPALGTPRFLVLYFASLLAGSFGALLLDPNALTYGASGAVFGLAGAAFVIARGRGLDALAGEIGFLIVFNLAFTFIYPHISIGGHLGGLVGGVLCALAIVAGEKGMLGRNRHLVEIAAMVAVAVVAVLGSLVVAEMPPSAAGRGTGARRAMKSTLPGGSTRSGWRMWPSSSTPSTRRGPGSQKSVPSTAKSRDAPRSAIRSQCSIDCARAASSGTSGITTTTSAPRLSSSPQPTLGGFSPGSPATSSPPAIEIISGIQKPPTRGGSSRCSAITRGEPLPETAARTAASRPSSSPRSSCPSCSIPVASPSRTTSSSISLSVAIRIVNSISHLGGDSCAAATARRAIFTGPHGRRRPSPKYRAA
ncbi:MAG TPA: rhomboid family intramembrane serine protease [Solirubrobacterales bacterium]|nr:rhomboid family intramembrane serine protease [Solirubrobacterales bacterium]